jgi:cellobiose phosphorylase
LPSVISQAKVKRVYRGVTYIIHIDNSSKNHIGVSKIEVNGKIISGNLLPLLQNGSKAEVRVFL